jgi:hypothetical protein
MLRGFELEGQRASCRLDGTTVVEWGDQHQGQEGQRKPLHSSPNHAATPTVGPFGGRRRNHSSLSLPRRLM